MTRKVADHAFPLLCRCAALVAPLVLVLGAPAVAQQIEDPDPADWDYEIRLDQDEYQVGETVRATPGVVAREAGVQGWSYGVAHDPDILEIQSVTSEGTDVPTVYDDGFEQTTIVEDPDTSVKLGFIQAIVLSFLNPAEIPVSDFFSMAEATYTVKDGVCDGQEGDITTPIQFTEELAFVPSPPVDLNLTVAGIGFVPEKVLGADVTIKCQEPQPGDLALVFDKTDTDLVADQSSVYDLKVLFDNPGESPVEFLGWSYGVVFDDTLLEAVAGEPGAASAALNGGSGPEFLVYNLDEESEDGSLDGVVVGVVIELDAPARETLAVPGGETRHIDTIQLRSVVTIPEGGEPVETTIGFSDQLGGDRPVEVLATYVDGNDVVPDFTDTLTLTLLPSGVVERPRFIRGDANNDARVDISDGVWIISWLFYGDEPPPCLAAADADDNGARNLTDAMYIFQYQLQPGATPGNLFPAPPAPFPDCGTDPDVTMEDCETSTCMP